MERPRPEPPSSRLVVKKGSNSRSRSPCGTPRPSSATDTTTVPKDAPALIVTLKAHSLPAAAADIALMMDDESALITAVNGAAAGIGCSIALIGDLIIAGKSAYFLQAFRHVGLVPDGGSAYILTRAIGRVRALEMMLLGQKYPAEKAYETGLITRLVEDDAVEATAAALAADLAAGPGFSLRGIRHAAWAAYERSFSEQLQTERELQRTATRTDDFVEGVKAFRERRKPRFTGK